MRICSLLPGATEIAYLLGLGDQIVGVTHECDYPHEAKQKPARRSKCHRFEPNVRARRSIAKLANCLKQVEASTRSTKHAFLEPAPDVILTQGLCDVCALDYDEVVKAAQLLPRMPVILSLNPHSFVRCARRYFACRRRHRPRHGRRSSSPGSAPAH